MFEVGFTELLLISALALIVLGPEKLPRVAAQVGRWVGRARAMARQFREQLEDEASLESRPKPAQATAAPSATPAAAATAAPAAAAAPAPEKYYQPDDDTQRADVSHADAGAEPEPAAGADIAAPTDVKDERGA